MESDLLCQSHKLRILSAACVMMWLILRLLLGRNASALFQVIKRHG